MWLLLAAAAHPRFAPLGVSMVTPGVKAISKTSALFVRLGAALVNLLQPQVEALFFKVTEAVTAEPVVRVAAARVDIPGMEVLAAGVAPTVLLATAAAAAAEQGVAPTAAAAAGCQYWAKVLLAVAERTTIPTPAVAAAAPAVRMARQVMASVVSLEAAMAVIMAVVVVPLVARAALVTVQARAMMA